MHPRTHRPHDEVPLVDEHAAQRGYERQRPAPLAAHSDAAPQLRGQLLQRGEATQVDLRHDQVTQKDSKVTQSHTARSHKVTQHGHTTVHLTHQHEQPVFPPTSATSWTTKKFQSMKQSVSVRDHVGLAVFKNTLRAPWLPTPSRLRCLGQKNTEICSAESQDPRARATLEFRCNGRL